MQTPPTDTTRLVRGFGGQQFAWGTAGLRNGKQLKAYLPVSATGVDMLVTYYLTAPDGSPSPKPKFLPVDEVQWLRIRGQYSALLKEKKREPGRIGARRVAGPVELYVVKAASAPTTSFLGPTPVLSAPATSTQTTEPEAVRWYLRRADGTLVLVTPENFARQVSTFLADDAELARRVAAGQPGHGPAELEALIRQYNERARSR